MSRTRTLADIDWEYQTGQLSYEDYRRDIKKVWSEKSGSPAQNPCTVEFEPEPHIAARTTLSRSGGGMER